MLIWLAPAANWTWGVTRMRGIQNARDCRGQTQQCWECRQKTKGWWWLDTPWMLASSTTAHGEISGTHPGEQSFGQVRERPTLLAAPRVSAGQPPLPTRWRIMWPPGSRLWNNRHVHIKYISPYSPVGKSSPCPCWGRGAQNTLEGRVSKVCSREEKLTWPDRRTTAVLLLMNV